MKTPLYMKALHFRIGKDNHLVLRGMVTNRADFAVPPARIFVSLHDSQDKMISRGGAALPAVPPWRTTPFEIKYALRDAAFFTVRSRLEKLQDVDYIDFNFALQSWLRAGGGRSPGGTHNE
jgi:hypothetical protein